MTLSNETAPGIGEDSIVVEPPMVRIHKPFSVDAPQAAARLAGVEADRRPAMFQTFLELGAQAYDSVQTSTTLKLMEQRLTEMDGKLAQTLTDILHKDRAGAKEELTQLLTDHSINVGRTMTRYLDPTSEESLPSVATQKLQKVSAETIKQVEALLADEEDGALGKAVAKVCKQLADATLQICEQVAAKQALVTRSARRGRKFEDGLTSALSFNARPLGGQVERCGDTFGLKRQRHGDHLVTLTSPKGLTLRIVTEAKSSEKAEKAFTLEAVRAACRAARANRDAQAAIFVADCPELLPDGLSFGVAGPGDYWVAFDSSGDDLGLAVALHLAVTAAMSTVGAAGDDLDLDALQGEVAAIRSQLEAFLTLETYHSKADKAVEGARATADSIKGTILGRLRRLDDLLAA
jgi:hypothetical protein